MITEGSTVLIWALVKKEPTLVGGDFQSTERVAFGTGIYPRRLTGRDTVNWDCYMHLFFPINECVRVCITITFTLAGFLTPERLKEMSHLQPTD